VKRIVPRAAVPFDEFLVSTLRHTQEHAAQLSLFLGQNDVEPRGGALGTQQRQLLVDAVRGRTDAEIDRFAKRVGGYPRLLPLVFAGFCANIDPRAPANVAFDLGSTYVVRVLPDAPAMFEQGSSYDAEATVRMSPQDFLRMMVRELPYDGGLRDGRIAVDGDARAVQRLFGMSRTL
jgi:hypothetical protein